MLSFILAYGDGEYKKKIKFAGSYSSLASQRTNVIKYL